MRYLSLATTAGNHSRKITDCVGENLPEAYLPHALYCPQTLVDRKLSVLGISTAQS